MLVFFYQRSIFLILAHCYVKSKMPLPTGNHMLFHLDKGPGSSVSPVNLQSSDRSVCQRTASAVAQKVEN